MITHACLVHPSVGSFFLERHKLTSLNHLLHTRSLSSPAACCYISFKTYGVKGGTMIFKQEGTALDVALEANTWQ